MLVGFLIGLLAAPQIILAAASGNYTDLLPVGAAGNTTVISNGSGWSLTTLAPSQTFGDALSRAPMTVYQATSPVTFASSTAVSTFTAQGGQGFVGSTTFPASWVATGRNIRISAKGFYGTTSTPNWTWQVLLGTTVVVNTGAVPAPSAVTGQYWKEECLLTIENPAASGTVIGSCDIFVATTTSGTSLVSYSTSSIAATVGLNTQLTVNPTFTWGTSSSANTITANNVTVEFLN
jgi:hypothetical protein